MAMTEIDYDKLSDRELDALIAKQVMGWANIDLYPALGSTDAYYSGIDPAVNDHRPIPKYSTDDNSVRLVRNRIEELGLVAEYCRALRDILDPERITLEASNPMHNFVHTWTGYQATPRQQCIAALRAVKGKGDR